VISVLTAALPGRAHMLDEAIASVKHQTDVDFEHLYAFDTDRRGAGPVLNELLEQASGEQVMVLDDDDLLLPHHLAALHGYDADVVYAPPIVEGGVFTLYDRPFNPDLLARWNIVSHTALMRTGLVRSLGGWEPRRDFDWSMFKKLLAAGASFFRHPDKTWIYRLHGANWSQGTL
jgi:glycosyltransferase involved in cell wall biosynthesis